MSGAGFIRRYSYFPGTEELTAIEGVVIVDQKVPGGIDGASYGVVAAVGECADMSLTCVVNSSGQVVSSYRPAEVYGGSDLVNRIGPIDSKLGKFGAEMGNLFVELRNKAFSRLVVQPVDLIRPASGTTQYGIRVWRDLPTNRSATDTTPIIPVSGYSVPAGTEFRSGSNRAYLAQKVNFTGLAPRSVGIDGVTLSVVGGATRTITRVAGSFVTDGVIVGDAVIVGSLTSATGTQNGDCALAGTLRVTAVNSNGLEITVQKQDGSDFTDTVDWRVGAALAFRVHVGSDADSGYTGALSAAGQYTVLARPGVGTIAANVAPGTTTLTPYPVPTASSSTYWAGDSGLAGTTHPTGALTYDADVHAVNPSTTSLIRARYQEALDALKNDDTPTNVISVVTCARKDSTIQSYLRLHCLDCSARGLTRDYVLAPTLTTVAKATVLGSAAPGVGGSGGAVRHERGFYSWPGSRTFIPELVGISIACPDGTTTDDGIVDVTTDTWLAALLSKLQPELNPGQAAEPVPTVLAPIIGYQRGCPTLDMNDYILFKQAGICALRMDRVVGPIFQSGITTSLTTGETNINRRRMADFIQDSLAARYNQMAKMLGRQSIKDALLSESDAFLADLLSENNPDAQRIDSYLLDDKSGNTPALGAQGVWIIRHKVFMLQTLDVIVAQSEIGPGGITVTAS